jgi:hypothetical protein
MHRHHHQLPRPQAKQHLHLQDLGRPPWHTCTRIAAVAAPRH